MLGISRLSCISNISEKLSVEIKNLDTDAVELLRILDTRHAHQQEIDDLDEDHQNIKHNISLNIKHIIIGGTNKIQLRVGCISIMHFSLSSRVVVSS